jgi:hypothetical protein
MERAEKRLGSVYQRYCHPTASSAKSRATLTPTSKVSQRIDLVAKDWNWEVIFRVQP